MDNPFWGFQGSSSQWKMVWRNESPTTVWPGKGFKTSPLVFATCFCHISASLGSAGHLWYVKFTTWDLTWARSGYLLSLSPNPTAQRVWYGMITIVKRVRHLHLMFDRVLVPVSLHPRRHAALTLKWSIAIFSNFDRRSYKIASRSQTNEAVKLKFINWAVFC